MFTDRSSSPTSPDRSRAPHDWPPRHSTWSPPIINERVLPPPIAAATEPAPARIGPNNTAETSRTDTLFGLSFDSLNRAEQFMIAVKGLAQDRRLCLADAVMIIKDDHGRVRVRETIDLQPGRTALSGATWTGLAGLLVGGLLGWIVGLGLGASIGAVVAKVVDRGVPDEWVNWFKDAVRPDTATVVVLASDIDHRALGFEIDRFPGVRLVHTTVGVDALSQLRSAFNDRVPTR